MPAHRTFRRRFAHSHSGSQFLPHLPSHWYSDILPPHCGQTRLRIDERMRTFNSPGGASMVIMFEVSRRSGEGRNGGRMTEVCCAGFVRFVMLRTGWLRSPFMRLVLPLAQHGASNLDATVNRQQKPLTKLVATKPDFYRVYTWASNGHACPNSGAVWCIRNSEGAAARPDKVTRQDGALPMRPKGKRKWGILPPKSAKSTTQQSCERRSNDSVWKVKCLEEVGEERLSAQRRVEPQCESHSSQ